MTRKKAIPNICFQCGAFVTDDKADAVRWDGLDVCYCNQGCFDARRAEEQHLRLWTTAIHEAGHVLGARLGNRHITSATIVPDEKKEFLGCVYSVTDCDKTWKEANAYRIEEWLLGHAAVVEFGLDGDGHDYDYGQVTKMLKEPIRDAKSRAWSERTGICGRYVVGGVEHKHAPYSTWDINPRRYYDGTKMVDNVKDWKKSVRVTKAEWKPEFDRKVRKARRLAKKYRNYIEQIAKLLMVKPTLTDEDIPQL